MYRIKTIVSRNFKSTTYTPFYYLNLKSATELNLNHLCRVMTHRTVVN